jgi:DNA-nicking Smr family endonuclease
MSGRVRGGDRRVLRRLRAGRIPFERSVDLHGLRSGEARRAVQQGLEAAREEEVRCLLIIHGRGHHSEGEAVLQPALVEWLTQEPLGRFVLAFASARPEHGGAGATYVLLRRARH